MSTTGTYSTVQAGIEGNETLINTVYTNFTAGLGLEELNAPPPNTGRTLTVSIDLDIVSTNTSVIEAGANMTVSPSTTNNVTTYTVASTGDFATTAQGALADSALQAEADTLQTVVTRGGTVTNGIVTIDPANARTNTYGGALTVLGERVQEGTNTTATGSYSHAEGRDTTASGYASHSEGFATEATGNYSHSEGRDTLASGSASHAEGWDTTASGNYSHAAGRNATASDDYTYVWADGAATSSSTTKQYTVHADNGIRLLGVAGVYVEAAVELGHATDTTFARASAGDVNIEGNIIYRAGGTDVPDGDVADTLTIGAGSTIGAVDGNAITNVDAITLGGESASAFEDADADIAKTDVAETITANWVNTNYPWAANELVSTVLVEADLNTFSELDTLVTNKTLVNEEDAATFDSMIDLAVDAVAGTDAVNYQTMVAYEWVTAPASNTAAGTAGQKAYDDNYLYICVSNATWRRTTLATW